MSEKSSVEALKTFLKTGDPEESLKSDDIVEVLAAILYLTSDGDDPDRTQYLLAEMIDHQNRDVAGVAITCLGRVARLYGRLDKDRIVPLLQEKAKDKKFAKRVNNALNEIARFA